MGIGLSVLAAVGFFLSARAHSWFFSDDYIALHLATNLSFGDFLITPIDVHFLPLHRLATWLIYASFPLNFDVALLVMCLFHVAGVWMLYRTLCLVGDSRLNGPLTALYGANFYAAVLLIWWTVGIARFPYVFFSLAAIHQYLKFRQDGSLVRALGILVCLVSAAAFFTKALLIPGFLAALELVLLPETPRRKVARNVAVLCVAGAVAVGYYNTGVSYGVQDLEAPPLNWELQKTALEIALTKIVQSVPGLLPSQPLSILNRMVVAIWVAFFAVSVWRDRFNVVVWAVGAVVVIVNFLVITLSQRFWFGAQLVANDRYYFENLHLIVIFLAIVGRRMRLDEWLENLNRDRVVSAVVWLTVCVLAIGSQARFYDTMKLPRYEQFRAAKEFGWNLTESMAELRRAHSITPLRFENAPVPLIVLKIAAMEVRNYSEILPIFDANIEFVGKDVCRYSVQDDGTIRPPAGTCPW